MNSHNPLITVIDRHKPSDCGQNLSACYACFEVPYTMTDIHNLRGFVQISVVLICVGVSSVDTASVQTVDEALYMFKEQDNMGDEALELREENRGYPDRCRLGK